MQNGCVCLSLCVEHTGERELSAKRMNRSRCPFEGEESRIGPRNSVLDGGAHLRHLAYMIERFLHGVDAAICQVTMTTC